MKTHEFVSAVQDTAGIADHDHAEQAVRGTLSVLGERLGTEAKDLAAQLPSEPASPLSTDDSVDRCLTQRGRGDYADLTHTENAQH